MEWIRFPFWVIIFVQGMEKTKIPMLSLEQVFVRHTVVLNFFSAVKIFKWCYFLFLFEWQYLLWLLFSFASVPLAYNHHRQKEKLNVCSTFKKKKRRSTDTCFLFLRGLLELIYFNFINGFDCNCVTFLLRGSCTYCNLYHHHCQNRQPPHHHCYHLHLDHHHDNPPPSTPLIPLHPHPP